MNGNAAPVRVELRNSFHHLPPGSKALKKTNGQRWLELTLGVRGLQRLPELSDVEQLLP